MSFRCILPIFVAAGAAQAAVVLSDDFSSGNLSGGTGWSGAWLPTATLPTTPVVSSGTPLKPGSAEYVTVGASTATVTHALRRVMPTVTATSPYTVTFDWRLDTPLTTFTAFGDRVHIGGSAGDVNSNNTFSWLVGVAAADSASNLVPDGNWYVYNYTDNDAFSGANLIDTTVALVSGVVYSFVVNVNPGNGTYTVNFTSSDSKSFTSGTLKFRNQNSAVTNNLVFASTTSATNEVATFSFDNVTIDGVPEPCSVALFGALGGIAMIRRRRD